MYAYRFTFLYWKQSENDGTQVSTDTYIETLDTSDSSTETDTEEETTFQLSVENGFGSGIYEEGETVHVFADFMPEMRLSQLER